MEDRAKLLGLGEPYANNENFRQAFDEMHSAVEHLPADLLDRGRELPYPQLHNACIAGDLELIKALLVTGIPADTYPCTEDDEDEPALVWLAREKGMALAAKVKVASLLLSHGADVDEGGALEWAEELGEKGFAKFLREYGASDS